MLRFEKFKFVGFKDSTRCLNLELSKESVTVIYGENGCGKTTFLKLIKAILNKEENVLIKENVNEVTIEFSASENYIKDTFKTIEETLIKKKLEQELFDVDNGYENYIIKRDLYKSKFIDCLKLNMKFEIKIKKVIDGYDWSEFDNSLLVYSKSMLFGTERDIVDTSEDYFLSSTLRKKMSMMRKNNIVENLKNEFSYNNYDELFNIVNDISVDKGRNALMGFNQTKKKHVNFDDYKYDIVEKNILRRYVEIREIISKIIKGALSNALMMELKEEASKTIDDVKFQEDLEKYKEILYDAFSENDNDLTELEMIMRNIFLENDIKKIIEESKKNNVDYLISKIIMGIEVNDKFLNSLKTLKTIFDDAIGKYKELIIEKESVYIQIKNGDKKKHTLKALSSGERHLLLFLTMFITDGVDRDFALIDEPGIYFGIKWQREILRTLSDLCPKTQIIVATHSPSLTRNNREYIRKMKGFYQD